MTKRIQRKREKGYKTPPKTKFCGRTNGYNLYCNPYRIVEVGPGKYILENTLNNQMGETIHSSKEAAAKKAVQMFGWWINRKYQTEEELKKFLAPLREYDYLSCWCPVDATHCHVDYLITLINKFWTEAE
jgi:hypothetical protein